MKSWVFLAMLLFEGVAFGKAVYFGSQPEVIRLPYGKKTVFRFPGEVRTITGAERFEVAPADGEQPNYSLLSITPRFSTGTSQVAFILGDSTIINTRLIVGGSGHDLVYDFKSKDTLIENDLATGSVSDLELMKILIRGEDPESFQVRTEDKLMRPGFKGVETKLTRLYRGDELNGYVFEITNVSKNSLSINIQNLMVGDPDQAILSNVEPQVIDPKEKAILRVVAKPKSLYNKLILPIETVEKR